MIWLNNLSLQKRLDELQASMQEHLAQTLDNQVLEELDLEGKLIVITGASGAWGSNLARICADAGANLVLISHKTAIDPDEYRNNRYPDQKIFTDQLDLTDEDNVFGLWLDLNIGVYGGLGAVDVDGLFITHGVEINDLEIEKDVEFKDKLVASNMSIQ